MGRSEAISSHLKPSIIGVTIYRATYRAFVRLGDDDRINFRPRSFRERYPARACVYIRVNALPAATTIERLHGSLRSERPPSSVLSISPTPFISSSPRR